MLRKLISLTLAAIAATSLAQFEMPVTQPKFILVSHPKVQEHLKFTSEQTKRMAAVLDGVVQDDGEGRRMVMLTGDTDLEQLDKDAMAVLDKDQAKRFFEIYAQQSGYTALSLREYADKVGVTEEQGKKLESVWADHKERMHKFFVEEHAGSQEVKVTKEGLAKIKKETDSQAEAILTKDQVEAWKKLLGEKFEFDEV